MGRNLMAITQLSFINNTFAKIRTTVLEALGYTPENVANKTTTLSGTSDILYPTEKTVYDAIALKQNILFYDSEIKAFIIEEEEYES